MNYRLLADIVAGLHVAYVLGVVGGLVLILLGKALGWTWVRNRWFRLAHLGMILGVVLRATVWEECPLTWWERDLRTLAGQVDYEGSSVGWFLHALVHPDEFGAVLPHSFYLTLYSVFGLLILGAFWLVPVDWRLPATSATSHQSTTAPSSSS